MASANGKAMMAARTTSIFQSLRLSARSMRLSLAVVLLLALQGTLASWAVADAASPGTTTVEQPCRSAQGPAAPADAPCDASHCCALCVHGARKLLSPDMSLATAAPGALTPPAAIVFFRRRPSRQRGRVARWRSGWSSRAPPRFS